LGKERPSQVNNNCQLPPTARTVRYPVPSHAALLTTLPFLDIPPDTLCVGSSINRGFRALMRMVFLADIGCQFGAPFAFTRGSCSHPLLPTCTASPSRTGDAPTKWNTSGDQNSLRSPISGCGTSSSPDDYEFLISPLT
jgi:hypothetical protein